MEDKVASTADALELLTMNQTALRAAIEEVSTWIRQRGSVDTHDNVMVALQALDTNAGAINSAIERLRT
jgi:predicted phage tail protein